jgi:hypothetical protein
MDLHGELRTPAARPSWRYVLVIVAGLEALAAAIWLIPASIHVVEWPASGPSRVALFAPQARLLWLGLGALAAGAVVIARATDSKAPARLAGVAGALCLLWLWTVPYLPWLPDRIPMLLVLAGPSRWLIASLAIVAAGFRAMPGGVDYFDYSGFGVGRTLPKWRRQVFVWSLVLYAGFGLLNARRVGPGGDEPHYLIISQSLMADGDLKIENNHQRREYRTFWGGELRPDYMKRGVDGEIYSIHAPGLPVLLLPAYVAAGYLGTVLILALMAALTALAIFDLAHGIAGPLAAFATWAAVGLTVPFVPHAWLVSPEMPGALVVAWSALWLWQPADQRPGTWFWRGVTLASLPWLHTKLVILLVIFGAALVWRARTSTKLFVAFLVPIVLSVAGWLTFFSLFYGSVNPEAPYGGYPAIYVLAKNIPRGLLGLMFDQKFGLLFYSPIYLFAIAGSWNMLRRPDTRFLGAVLLIATAAHVGSTTRLYMWWGGTSAPARFLVPILPCLAPMIALEINALRRRVGKTVFGICLACSLLVAAAGAGWPGRLLLFSDSRGYARLLETIQSGAPLTFSLPTFTYEDWQTPIRPLLVWLLAGGVAGAALIAAGLRLKPIWLTAVGGVTLLVSADLLAGRPEAAVREEMTRRGKLDLIWQYDGARLRPFEYRTLEKIDETKVRAFGRLTFPQYPVPGFALPQGTYEARVWFSSALQRRGEIVVSSMSSGQRVTFAQHLGVMTNPTIVPFELPVATGRLSVAVSDQSLASLVARVEILPTVLTSLSRREPRPARRIEEIADRPQAYLIYVDEHAYPEGGVFWTRGAERAEVLLAPGPYSRIRLTVHLGPRSGDVKINAVGEERIVRVEANSTAEVQLKVPHGLELVPITIQSPTMFRPSEVDPKSGDTRSLGAQVRVSVE